MAPIFTVGGWTVEPDLDTISLNGNSTHVEPKAMEVLVRLAESPGQTLSKDELIKSVWPDTFVGDDVLSRSVYELRKAFGDDTHEPKIIQTIPKRGYRLIALVERPQQKRLRRHALRQPAAMVATVALLVLMMAVGYWWHRRSAQAVVIDSIAVLPFTDMSPGRDQEYLAEGMSEELINALAKIPELQVTARTSSFQFRGKKEDLRGIGHKLNVRSVMEGSVRRDGNRVRIAVQLINVENGFHLWSESYDRDVSDVFAVQEEIARSAAAALKVRFLTKRIAQSTTPEAYNAYLQGQFFASQGTEESLQKALSYYQQTIKLDPEYAPAWAGLGHCYFDLGPIAGSLPPENSVRKAREAAERALALDPKLPDTYILLGDIKQWWDYDWEGADAAYARALELQPGNTIALARGAFLDASLDHCERGMNRGLRGAQLDPFNRETQKYLAASARDCERWDEAEAAAKRLVELGGDQLLLAEILVVRSKPTEALAAAEHVRQPASRYFVLALAYQATGERGKADAALLELVAKYGELLDYQIATVYAFRGDADSAFKWLEHAYLSRSAGLTCARKDPLLKSLRGDPRWKPFMKKMNFPL